MYFYGPLLFCLLTIGGWAQNALQKKGWYVGLTGSPDYAYRLLKNDGGSTWQDVFNIRDSIERPKIAFTVGITVLKQFNDRMSLDMGILFSEKGEKTREYGMNPILDFVPNRQQVRYNTNYLEIPLKFNYYLLDREISPYLTGGISGNVFLYEKVTMHNTYYIHNPDGSTDIRKEMTTKEIPPGIAPIDTEIKERGYYRVNAQLQVGFGIDFTRNRVKIKLEPLFKLSLSDVNNEPLNRKFYSIGLNAGIFFKTKADKNLRVRHARGLE